MIGRAVRRFGWTMIVAGLLVSVAYVAARNLGAGHIRITHVRHTVLADSAELLRADLFRGAANAGELIVVFVDPEAVRLDVVQNPGRKKLASLAPDAQLVMNAGYFTPEFRPTGLLVSQGKVLSPFISSGGPAGSGVVVVEDGKVDMLRREDVGARAFDDAEIAIQAGPRLIEADGRPGIRSDDGRHANRTFIGADTRGWLVIGVVYRGDGGLGGGPSLFELQRLLLNLKKPGRRIAFALNLDGGPSTGFHLRTDPNLDLVEAGAVFSAVTVRARSR